MSKKQNWLVVLAGPNGAGKSTFYNNILRTDPLFKNAEYINLDEYAKELAGRGNPEDFFIQAGRMVRNNIDKNLQENKSFVYETTSAGLSHLKIMDRARAQGYKVATVFIGLSRVELSHLRVQKRINEGGHSVPADDIERRYPRVIKNFPDMLARSDMAAVFDNSGPEPYRLIFLMDTYNFKVFYKYPKWVEKALENRK
ncbi:MAG: zeta toxin family protein, partial [Alphaproteobacteria bacterium]|nr:zeta toxin family protein [Alphaproteobacteria bacterium]